MIKLTKKMLEVETRVGQSLETYLRSSYECEHKSTIEIAEELGVGRSTMSRWLNDYDIEMRTASEAKLPKGFVKPSEERLRTWYEDEHKTTTEIAEELGIGHKVVSRLLKDYGIEVRTASESRFPKEFEKPSKEQLITWYIDEHKSTNEIAEELGVSNPTVGTWLNNYGIEIRTISESKLPAGFEKPSEKELRTSYLDERKTLAEIAEEIGVSKSTIGAWLNDSGIEIRTISESKLPAGFEKPSEKELRTSYLDERKTLAEIAEEIGVSKFTIGAWLNDSGIEIRTISEARLPSGFVKPSEERLRTLYVDQHKSQTKIAKELGVGISTIGTWLNDYDIEIRLSSESQLPTGVKKPSEERLRTLYLDECKSANEIAEEIGVGDSTVRRWLNGYKINRDQEELKKLEDLVRGYLEND